MMLDENGLVRFVITDQEPPKVEKPAPQEVKIFHDPQTGKLDITYSNLNHLKVIHLLMDALYIIWKDGVKSSERPDFPNVKSKVCLQMEDNKISMSFGTQAAGGTVADPILAKAILLSGLFGLCEKTNSGEFNPADAFSGMLTVRR